MVITDSIRQELHGATGFPVGHFKPNTILSVYGDDNGFGAILSSKVHIAFAFGEWPSEVKEQIAENPLLQALVGTAVVLNANKMLGMICKLFCLSKKSHAAHAGRRNV